ncbi:hypothetical protein E4T42_02914 [Aureobasidium subglaciale]|nr:hypothetical protein E4T42_02914 [Aureobasidium subglaciale]
MAKVDLTLPESVPQMARHHTRPMTLDPFALYFLVDCTHDLDEIIKACNSECLRDDYVQCRTRTAFESGSLNEIISHHVVVCEAEHLDPRYIIVVANEDWKKSGVVMVTLDDDDLECKPDLFWIKVGDSGLVLVNLQIANTDWFEVKESYEITEEPEPWSGETFADGAPTKTPGTGFYIAFYAIKGIDSGGLVQKVQPFPSQPVEDYCCRFEGHLEHDLDVVEEATQLHLKQCLVNPLLQKDMIFVADTLEYVEKGLLMCNIEERQEKRVQCLVHTLVPTFCQIAQGRSKWSDLQSEA